VARLSGTVAGLSGVRAVVFAGSHRIRVPRDGNGAMAVGRSALRVTVVTGSVGGRAGRLMVRAGRDRHGTSKAVGSVRRGKATRPAAAAKMPKATTGAASSDPPQAIATLESGPRVSVVNCEAARAVSPVAGRPTEARVDSLHNGSAAKARVTLDAPAAAD
jgi:hypothetical protein